MSGVHNNLVERILDMLQKNILEGTDPSDFGISSNQLESNEDMTLVQY